MGLYFMERGEFSMRQLKLPFKNTDIEEWNYLMENSYKFRFSIEQHDFVTKMKRKHGWNFGDKVELDGRITPWGFENFEAEVEPCDPEWEDEVVSFEPCIIDLDWINEDER